MDSIEEDIRRVQAGEVERFEPIVEAYQKQIYIYSCRMLGCKQDAQDAVQDIFIKAFTKIGSFEAKSAFSSWLYKIAYHHCLNMLRKRNVRLRVGRLIRGAGVTDSPEQTLERGWFSEPLEYAVSKLSGEERNLLVLRVFEDKPFAEIAEILDKSEGAVKKKYMRMRDKLVRLMEEKGGAEGCGATNNSKKLEC